MTYKEIYMTALKFNKNKYLSILGVNLFFLLVSGILSVSAVLSDRYLISTTFFNNGTVTAFIRIISFLSIAIITHIIFSGFSLGKTAVFSGRVNRKRASVKRIIYWLKPSKALKAFGLNVVLFILKALWATAFLLPGSVILFTILYLAFTGGIEVYLLLSLIFSGVLLVIVGFMFTFVISQRYFLAKFLLTENPRLKIFQVIRQSKNLMEYQLMTVVKFKLSYIFPFMLSIFIIPFIFLYPHYKQSLSILAKELTV